MTSTQTESDAPRTEEAPAELFDIARDEIPSFGALEQQRATIYERRTTLESFRRKVEALSESGEEGRRKGLGSWLVGELEQAVDLLARHEKDDVAAFTRANALLSLGRPAEAVPIFERLTKDYPDEPRPRAGWIEARLEASLAGGNEEAAAAALEEDLSSAPKSFAGGAEELYLRGRAAELLRERQAALDFYEEAREIQPSHRRNLFRLAHLAERTGLDALALDAYRRLASELPIDRNVLMNLGVLYEDMGREQDAATCFDTVLKSDPTDRRARLFLSDARAGMNMFYDEDMERKEDRLNQILRIPITDFELSVRARNCLNKMDIMTLGDLVKKTEAELLAYKNFGETSLNEIKEILASKGLRLGMAREEAVASIARSPTTPRVVSNDPSDARNKPIAELKLSIRARRTIENLGCLTLGDVTQHTEEELLGMPNFGVTSLLELKNKLTEYGLKIKSD